MTSGTSLLPRIPQQRSTTTTATSGWARLDARRWESILARLRELGPLTKDEALQDLRFWETLRAHGHRPPTNRELATRWGWLTRAGNPAEATVRRLRASADPGVHDGR